jgi:phosphatidylserine/phosphatidylglycerophosphate/cardiolipin synthase-like enzyme
VKEIESTEDSTLIPDAKFYFDDKTLPQFESFVADARNSLQILTHSISYDAVERVFANIGPIDSVEIVTFRRHGTERIREFLIKKGVKKVEIKRLQYLHAKFCIQDGKKILVSSANITVRSLGHPPEGGFVEASIVSSNESTVKKALALFEAVVKEETVQTIEAGPAEDFLSSAYGIPERILGLIRESREICIIVSPFIDDYIFSVIQSTIQSTDIKVVTTWPSKASKNNRNELLLLNKFGDFKLVDFVPVRQQIHAKVYVFTLTNGKKTAFISSMNMMRNSWYANVEAGVLTEDEDIITAIDHVVSRLMRVTTVNSPEIMSLQPRVEAMEKKRSFQSLF